MGKSLHIKIAGEIGIHEGGKVNLERLMEIEKDTLQFGHDFNEGENNLLYLRLHQSFRRMNPGIEPTLNGLEHSGKNRMLREHHIG